MPSTAPNFTQVSTPRLYALSSSASAGVPDYWAGYLPGAAASFGATLTLEQVWNDIGGIYLFLNQTPADFNVFLAALQAYLQIVSPTGAVRLLWLANPNEATSAWSSQVLLATGQTGSPAIWTVPRQASFALGGYAVQVNAGTALTQADTFGYGIQFASASCSLLAPGGSFTPSTGTFWLPLMGASLGAWTSSLPVASQNGVDGFTALGVQLRYAVPAGSDTTEDGVQPVGMPVMTQGQAAMTLALSFDPLNPLMAGRTSLSFFPATSTLPAFDSTLVTVLGYRTTLQPASLPAPLWPARLVFCFSPRFQSGGPSFNDYYLAPDGAFLLTTKTPAAVLEAAANSTGPADRITLGLSGLEYAGLAVATGSVALFQAGKPAYAPNAIAGTRRALQPLDDPALTSLATTSYVSLLPAAAGATGLSYFAQPRQAPLYVDSTDLGPGFMDFWEMPAATLDSYSPASAVPTGLPMGIYAAIDPALTAFARALELAALAPARRLAVGLAPASSLASVDTPALAVTPQGLLAQLSADGTQWASVILANRTGAPVLSFSPVGPAFQAALQANELFFVVSNVDTFFGNPPSTPVQTSVKYQLTAGNLLLLPAAGVPRTVVTALDTLLQAMTPPYPVFPTESAFTTAVGSTAGTYLPQVLAIAGLLKVSLDGWTFQLSPRSWRTATGSPTIMLFKYCSRTLEQMVADGSAWSWPEAAQDSTSSITATQKIVRSIFASASAAAPGTPYARFYEEVVRNPQWTGVLFLNAPVSIASLPAELQFATAGIDTDAFYAHHVGISMTPFYAAGGAITLGETSIFALIDYQDPADLLLASTVPFAFKTLALTARFANGALAGFAARVELMVNRLFGATLTKQQPEHGNNLVLNGGYQYQNGAPAYAFTLEGKDLYAAARSAVSSVEVVGVQIQTTSATSSATDLSVDFTLSGNLRMAELPGFDPFSYGAQTFYPQGSQPADGYLRFGNVMVNMAFSMATPRLQTFTAREGGLSFDLGNSLARPLSLAQNFPVSLARFLASPNTALAGDAPAGQTPEDLGFTSIAAPMEQSLLTSPWYGLVYNLDLGTLGALAGSVGLSMTVLAAWSTGAADDQRPVYLGLQFPNANSLGLSLPVQGVLRLGFRSFQFQASGTTTKRSYMLRLHRLALSILGWSFPPGTTDMYLFGNDQGDPKAALGWYAAYSAPDEAKDSSGLLTAKRAAATSPSRRRQSGRRGLPPGTGV